MGGGWWQEVGHKDPVKEQAVTWTWNKLNMLNELWVEEGESGELVLVEVHHEELVGGGELGALAGELPVEVGDVLPVALGGAWSAISYYRSMALV